MQINLTRHLELETALKKERRIKKFKNNIKILMIALIVLFIDRMSNFMLSLSTGYKFYRRPDLSGLNPEC